MAVGVAAVAPARTRRKRLRQRVALALSEILVVSDEVDTLAVYPHALSNYYDTLLTHAFGNYRDLLRAVTLHPAMGVYLSHVNNARANPAANTYPEIKPGNPLDVGRGIYAPTTAVDEYFAELALWFGVPASELGSVLPNVARFYSPGSPELPLGFLRA